MQSTDAKRIAVMGMAIVGGITVVSYARQGKVPPLRVGVGTVAGAAILSLIAGPAPEMAAGLTSLAVLSSLLGSDVLDAATKALAQPIASLRAAPKAGFTLTPTSSSAAPSSSLTSGGGSWGTITRAEAQAIVPTLVPIGYGTHRLEPGAAAKYKAATTALGAAIPVTDSWRSYDLQSAGHATQPNRFAPPGTSPHVRGKAIDIVNMNDAKTRSALLGAGWTQSRPSDEPWHYCSDGAH